MFYVIIHFGEIIISNCRVLYAYSEYIPISCQSNMHPNLFCGSVTIMS